MSTLQAQGLWQLAFLVKMIYLHKVSERLVLRVRQRIKAQAILLALATLSYKVLATHKRTLRAFLNN
ncbi:MAG: hypothetical protein LBI13_11140 [Streptococcaceae bacterium]|nr:hypothetical protein [Streptococcaceae bacterium]